MKPKSVRRRSSLRRKYKRYAAAVAGAALLTGAALPGLPVHAASAAVSPSVSAPTSVEQSVSKDYHRYNAKERVSREYRSERGDHSYRQHDRVTTVREMPNPVDTIKLYASVYGFNPDKDTFKFLNLTRYESSILVTKAATGESFRVDLERTSRFSDWRITNVYRSGI